MGLRHLDSTDNDIESVKIEDHRMRPYFSWQNGIVERCHRIENELFYYKRRFESYEQMEKSFSRYRARYNKIARKTLNFKTPSEVVVYFQKSCHKGLTTLEIS
ncbi:MAG TPA: integrase core domain-containing protein [Bacillota bacterium]|nr:integrase core domain-containing protein [Bacillota bacterium]